jgi:hypothetical protein
VDLECRANMLDAQSVQLHNFVPGSCAAKKFDTVAWAIQPVAEESDKRFVSGAIDRRRGDFDAQFVTERFANFV